jgi:hypothetical protein
MRSSRSLRLWWELIVVFSFEGTWFRPSSDVQRNSQRENAKPNRKMAFPDGY